MRLLGQQVQVFEEGLCDVLLNNYYLSCNRQSEHCLFGAIGMNSHGGAKVTPTKSRDKRSCVQL